MEQREIDNMLLSMIQKHFPSLPLSDEYTDWGKWLGFTRAVYEAGRASPASVPDNFKMVPVEPTPEMLTAGECESDSDRATYETVYAAMIASAPTPATWPDGTPRAFDNYAHDKQFSEDSPTPPVSEDWKDAKRYRWLRKEWFREDEDNSWFMQSESSFLESPDEFDAAIDAAMQEDKP